MNLKQKEAATKRINERKRKHEESTGAEQQKPKRVKNKEKYLPKGNKARKRAAAAQANGANAIPVQESRIRDVQESADGAAEPATAAAAVAASENKPMGEDFFVIDTTPIDTTPMDPAEVAEKKKSKGELKRERQAAKEAEHQSAEWLAAKEARKEKKKQEARARREAEDQKKAQRRQEKKEKRAKKKEWKQQEKSKKRKEEKKKAGEDKKEDEDESSSSDSESDSSSSSGSDSEVEVKKTAAPKAAEKKAEKKGKSEKKEKKEKPAAADSKEAKEEEEEATNKNRFIVFVGNLPYTATTESVTAHFSKIAPISVRVATDKNDSTKCRGFGFVEFEAFDRMQTCLKLYHHSSFDDGKSPARKINVELTAGGGGKSETRKTKLKQKNQKLAEERAKNAQEDKKKKGGKESATTKQEDGGEYSGIHPSRLNQMR